MTNSALGLEFPAVCSRPVTVSFDGGDLTSDAGLTLVAAADRKLGLTAALAGVIPEWRQAGKIQHPLVELLQTRVYAIALGYEDANDLDTNHNQDCRNDDNDSKENNLWQVHIH